MSLCGTQRLSPNAIAHSSAKRILRHEVNPSVEPRLELVLKPDEGKEADGVIEFNDQVDIAAFTCLIARY